MVNDRITTFKEGLWYVFYNQHVTDFDVEDDLFFSVQEFPTEKLGVTFAKNGFEDKSEYRVLIQATNYISVVYEQDGRRNIQSRIEEIAKDSKFSPKHFCYVNIILEPFCEMERYNLERHLVGRLPSTTPLSGAIRIKTWGQGYSMGV